MTYIYDAETNSLIACCVAGRIYKGEDTSSEIIGYYDDYGKIFTASDLKNPVARFDGKWLYKADVYADPLAEIHGNCIHLGKAIVGQCLTVAYSIGPFDFNGFAAATYLMKMRR